MEAGINLAPAEPEALLRQRWLGRRHGAANVGWLLLMHGLLIAWLWGGRGLVSFPVFLGLAVCACLVHQRMLSEWFHEATHWNLVPGRRWNDGLANLLIGTFNGTRVASNRPGHFRHHAATEFFTDADPDTRTAAAATRSELVRGVLCDLCGLNAVKTFLRGAEAGADGGKRTGTLAWFAWLATIHGLGVAATVSSGRYDIYPLYFGTLLTLYPVANRVRLYAQHAALDVDGRPRLVGSRIARTVHSGAFEQLLLHSPMIMYHHEHHARPALPYRALRAIATRSGDANRSTGSGFPIVRAVLTGLQ